MKLTLIRRYRKDNYTIGDLYIDGTRFCNTLEDKDRKLWYKDLLSKILKIKVKAETAIPTGIYEISMDVVSTKYSNYNKYPWAKECKGKVPRLLNVPGFEGILIHPGNYATDTEGCILVGENKIKGGIINSVVTWKNLYNILRNAKDKITIEIV